MVGSWFILEVGTARYSSLTPKRAFGEKTSEDTVTEHEGEVKFDFLGAEEKHLSSFRGRPHTSWWYSVTL